MDDTVLDGEHPDESRRLLRKQRKERRERRNRKRKKYGSSLKDLGKRKDRNKQKRKGGLLGNIMDFFLCECLCVSILPIIFGIILLAASIFIIAVDKITYSGYDAPPGQCLVTKSDPVTVVIQWKGKNYTKEMTNSYYMELNLQPGNVVPCVVDGKKVDTGSDAAYDSDPQLIDLLSYVICGVSSLILLLYIPFAAVTIFRCICGNCFMRYLYKVLLVVVNTAYLIFWIIFFALFLLGIMHIIIRSVNWYDIHALEKTKHEVVNCRVTDIQCKYVYNTVSISYDVKIDDENRRLLNGGVSNNKTGNNTKHYTKKITETMPNMCYKVNNVLPCIVDKKHPENPQIYYITPPTKWFWLIFGLVGGIALLLSCLACYGGCCLYPWFLLEIFICSGQAATGASKKVHYEELDDDYVDTRIFKL